MDGEGGSHLHLPPRRRKLALPVAVLAAAVVAVLVGIGAAGRPHNPATRLVYCGSIISFQDPGGPPPQISQPPPPALRLPGGGWLACGQIVEPGGSQPVGVVVKTGAVGLSATIPDGRVVTWDFTDHKLAGRRLRPGREYLLMLESSPNDAHMFIYAYSELLFRLHLAFV